MVEATGSWLLPRTAVKLPSLSSFPGAGNFAIQQFAVKVLQFNKARPARLCAHSVKYAIQPDSPFNVVFDGNMS
jgi:hypothetical protein